MINYNELPDKDNISSFQKEIIPEFIVSHVPSFESFIEQESLVKKIYDIDKKYHISDSLKRYAIFKVSFRLNLLEFHIEKSRINHITKSIVSIEKDKIMQFIEWKTNIWPRFEAWDLNTDKWKFELIKALSNNKKKYFVNADDFKYKKTKEKNEIEVKHKYEYIHMEYKDLYLVFLYLIKKSKLFLAIDWFTQDTYIIDSHNLHNIVNESAFTVIQIKECLQRWEKQNEENWRNKWFLKKRWKFWLQENKPNIEKMTREFEEDITEIQKLYPFEGKDKLIELSDFWLSQNSTSALNIEAKSNYWLLRPSIKNDNLKDDSIKEQVYKYGNIEIKNHILNSVESRHTIFQPTFKIWKTEKE